MLIQNGTFKNILLICFFIYQNAYSQNFKIISENKNQITLEFNFDTTNLKDFIKEEKVIDLSKIFYCINQLNKPLLPLFNYTFQLNDSSLNYNIKKAEKSFFKIHSIRRGEKSSKRGVKTESNFEKTIDLIKIYEPYFYRNFIGQNLQLCPIQFDSINNQLICHHKIVLSIQFDKPIKFEKLTSSNSNNTSNLSHFYSFKKIETKLKSVDLTNSELLIIYQDSNQSNAELLSNWKNQKGLKTNLLKLEKSKTSEEIKYEIKTFYSIHPALKYILILGNHSEIPAYNYGFIDGDNYFSDSYFGQFTNDYYPELFVGRITGSTLEIKSIIMKSIFYEKDNFEGDWMIKSIGIASNEGLGYGDNNESDWQHVQKIKTKLYDFGYSKVYEFYDGDHGGNDATGLPNKIDILNALNEGVSLLNYTGHGDDNLMLTSQLSSSDINLLNNENKNPFVISVACDNGKFITGQGTLAESFMKCKDIDKYTGSIAFCGSSILMDWAPPMLTQDEIINSITTQDTLKTIFSIGELFYESQIKMLNKYNTLGNGVMQTWILFGDPSLDLKTKLPQAIDLVYEYDNNSYELIIKSKTNNVLLGISKNNQLINSTILKSGENKMFIDTSYQNVLLTFTKPNYKTQQFNLTLNNNNKIEISDEIILYPNPANSENNYFIIKGLSKYNSIKLIDALGKDYDIDLKNELNELKIEHRNLSKGVYFIRITDINNQIITKRIVIQ